MVQATPRRYHDGLSDLEYDRLPGVRSSDLKMLVTASPAHARYRRASDPSPAMLKGLMVHCWALRPEAINRQFLTVSVGSRSATAYRDAVEKALPGQHVVLEKELKEASLVSAALYGHPVARRYMEAAGVCERVFQWAQDATACKCKVDKVLEDGTLLELKTTRSLDPRSWANDFAKYAYHLQLAHYHNGLCEVYGQLPPKVVVVAVETKAPFDVGVFTVGDEVLEQGRLMLDRAFALHLRCEKNQEWPGRYPEEVPFTLPGWAVEDFVLTGVTLGGKDL